MARGKASATKLNATETKKLDDLLGEIQDKGASMYDDYLEQIKYMVEASKKEIEEKGSSKITNVEILRILEENYGVKTPKDENGKYKTGAFSKFLNNNNISRGMSKALQKAQEARK